MLELLQNMHNTYIRKNHDYGNSINKSLNTFGLIATVVRIGDKVNRIETLKTQKARVADEKLSDTVVDLVNYAIATLMWLDPDHAPDLKFHEVLCERLSRRIADLGHFDPKDERANRSLRFSQIDHAYSRLVCETRKSDAAKSTAAVTTALDALALNGTLIALELGGYRAAEAV